MHAYVTVSSGLFKDISFTLYDKYSHEFTRTELMLPDGPGSERSLADSTGVPSSCMRVVTGARIG